MNFNSLKRFLCNLVAITNLVCLGSCEFKKETDYYEKFDIPNLITHGYICPQYGVQVIVKKSTSPSDVNGDDRVFNASVFLHKSKTEFIKLRQVTDYLFESDSLSFIEVNKSYYIRIESNEFGESISSCETILTTPQIDSVKIVTEPKDVVNVYFNNNYSTGESFILETYNYRDGKIEATDVIEKFNPYDMLKYVQVGHNAMEVSLTGYKQIDSVLIVLHVLSPDLSKFLISQQNYDLSNGDPFFPQPYPVFSNIKGGYGIFAAHSYHTVIARK